MQMDAQLQSLFRHLIVSRRQAPLMLKPGPCRAVVEVELLEAVEGGGAKPGVERGGGAGVVLQVVSGDAEAAAGAPV